MKHKYEIKKSTEHRDFTKREIALTTCGRALIVKENYWLMALIPLRGKEPCLMRLSKYARMKAYEGMIVDLRKASVFFVTTTRVDYGDTYTEEVMEEMPYLCF